MHPLAAAKMRAALKDLPPEQQREIGKRFLLRLTNETGLQEHHDIPGLDVPEDPVVRAAPAAQLANSGAVQGDPEMHFFARYTEEERAAAAAKFKADIADFPEGGKTVQMGPAAISPLRRLAEPAKYQRPHYGNLSPSAKQEVDRLEHYMRTAVAVGAGDPVEVYLRTGALLFECGFRERDDIDALVRATDALADVDAGPANEAIRMGAGSNLHTTMFCGRWFACGAPRVKIDAPQAAALMLTDLPDGFVDSELHQPWPAFIVELPDGLVPMGDDWGWARRLLVHRVRVGTADTLWWMMAQGAESGMSLGRRSLSDLQDIAELQRGGDDDRVAMFGLRIRTSHDAFTRFAALAKLLAGVCYKFQERPPAPIRSRSGGAIRRRPGGPPQTTEIKLGFPVKVDLSNVVRGHLLGHVKRLSKVQWLVRGHWRNQACGPQRSLRQMKWIEPFWKGPLDAPILVRTYVLGQTPKEST